MIIGSRRLPIAGYERRLISYSPSLLSCRPFASLGAAGTDPVTGHCPRNRSATVGMEDTRLPYAASYADESRLRGGLCFWAAWRACDHRRLPKTCDQKPAPELARVGGFDQEPPRRLYWMGGVRKESAPDRRQRQRKELFGARLDPSWRSAAPGSLPLRQVRKEAASLLWRKSNLLAAVCLSWRIQ